METADMTPTATHHSTQTVIPKTSPSLSNSVPPPAYSPRRPLDITNLPGRPYHHQHHQHHPQAPHIVMRPALALPRPPLVDVLSTSHDSASSSSTAVQDEGDDDEARAGEEASAISLRINTCVSVTQSNNLVCVTETPAAHANAIARAVVGALQEKSSGGCGIPMIDEDGRPRPLNVEVDASTAVDGSGNIVGPECVVREVLRQRAAMRRPREPDPEDGADDERRAKRRCSAS